MIRHESDAFFSNLVFMLILCRYTKIAFLLIMPILSVMRGRCLFSFLFSFHNFFTGLASDNGPQSNKHSSSPCGTG